MKPITNKVAVITGAGSGIGRAIAIELAHLGAAVALNDVVQESLEETEQVIVAAGGEAFSVLADISEESEVQSMVQKIIDHFGKVDLLFNNAGVTIARFDVAEMPSKWWHWLNNINFHGPMYCTKHFLPHILKSDAGHIVNVSSAYGLAGVYGRSAYCASKFGIRGFSEALHLELINSKVGVTLVYPGSIQTNIASHSRAWNNPKEKEKARAVQAKASKISPSKAAKIIIRGIRRNKVRILIGAEVKALDFMVRLFPSFAPRLIHYFLRRAEQT